MSLQNLAQIGRGVGQYQNEWKSYMPQFANWGQVELKVYLGGCRRADSAEPVDDGMDFNMACIWQEL